MFAVGDKVLLTLDDHLNDNDPAPRTPAVVAGYWTPTDTGPSDNSFYADSVDYPYYVSIESIDWLFLVADHELELVG